MQQRKHNYTGTNFSVRGEKDRFVLPASFRKIVTESSGGRYLFLSQHPNKPCLTAFGESYIGFMEAEIDKAEARAIAGGQDFDRDAAEINMGSMIEEVSFDASGRFTFPPLLRKLANIDETAVFLGSMKTITIWNPETFLQQDEKTYAGPMMNVREFLASHSSAGKSAGGGKKKK